MEYDIAIIGGGPAGYTAAERAAENSLRTILFERKAVGGVCLNEGCIPTKALLYSAKILDSIKSAAKYGIEADGNPGYSLDKMISRKNKTVKKLTAGVKMKLTSNDVTIVEGEALIAGEENGKIKINCNNEAYLVENVLICTGSDTVIPPIKGLTDTGYWTSREALDAKELPQTLAIIGGGVIGIEFASFFNSLGVKVKVIEMMPEILSVMDNEIAAALRSEYAKKGVEFYLQTKVTEVGKNSVTIEREGKTETLEAGKMLVSVGRKANIDHIGLDSLSIELHKNGIKVNEYMQASHPHVYACGDVTGYSLLAHTAYREAEVAINHILGKEDKMSYKAIPSVVYTNPEYAAVGVSEDELKKADIYYRSIKIPMTYSGRFMAENENFNGLFKLLIDENERILGCHILGNPASEFIIAAGIAIENGYTLDAFKKNVFPHPTVSEVLHESLYM